jgi:hypothetical protein
MEKLEKVDDKISLEVLKHSEVINNLVTRHEFNEKMDKVIEGQDKMMVILARLDQERIFTIERIRHVEEELNKIKVHLALS